MSLDIAPLPVLEVIANSWQGSDYEVQLFCAEFTCLCPFSGQPDFAELTISYVPSSCLVESCSLKRYLAAFRNLPLLQEFTVNQIYADLTAVLKPKRLTVKGEFVARGGIRISAIASAAKSSKR